MNKEETIQRILDVQSPYTTPMKLMSEAYDAALSQSAARIAELESRERALREALRLTQRTWQESFDAAAYSVQVTRHEMKNIQAALRGGGDQR